MIGNEKSINESEIPNLGQVKSLYPSFGIIEDQLCDLYPEINNLVCQVKEKLPDFDEKILN